MQAAFFLWAVATYLQLLFDIIAMKGVRTIARNADSHFKTDWGPETGTKFFQKFLSITEKWFVTSDQDKYFWLD